MWLLGRPLLAMTDIDPRQFEADQQRALLSLDREQIEAFLAKYGIVFERRTDENQFWAGIHRTRILLPGFPEREKERSREWLRARGLAERPGV